MRRKNSNRDWSDVQVAEQYLNRLDLGQGVFCYRFWAHNILEVAIHLLGDDPVPWYAMQVKILLLIAPPSSVFG